MKTVNSSDEPRFEGQLRRLKAALRVHEDQDAATALGMTKAALSLRKRRDAFPVDKLLALSSLQPELGLDVTYIVTGSTEMERMSLQRLQSVAPKEDKSEDAVRNARRPSQRTQPPAEHLLHIVSADRWDAVFQGKPRSRVPLVAWALVRADDGSQGIKGVVVGPASGMVYCEDQKEFLCYVPKDVQMP